MMEDNHEPQVRKIKGQRAELITMVSEKQDLLIRLKYLALGMAMFCNGLAIGLAFGAGDWRIPAIGLVAGWAFAILSWKLNDKIKACTKALEQLFSEDIAAFQEATTRD